MITDTIIAYRYYKHRESGRRAQVNTPNLHVKTDRHWQTCVAYTMEDSPDASFAVPLDEFRQRFEELTD